MEDWIYRYDYIIKVYKQIEGITDYNSATKNLKKQKNENDFVFN